MHLGARQAEILDVIVFSSLLSDFLKCPQSCWSFVSSSFPLKTDKKKKKKKKNTKETTTNNKEARDTKVSTVITSTASLEREFQSLIGAG